MEEFKKVLGDRPNEWDKQRDDTFGPKEWMDFQPEQPITEAGVRNNINVGIHYLGSWLAGNGCVPIHNLMEDAATAEISRSQIRSDERRVGKSVSVSFDLGGRRIIKIKTNKEHHLYWW